MFVPTHFRRYRVVTRKVESADTISLYLKPLDEYPATPYVPGQYVSVRVDDYKPREYCISNTYDHGLLRLLIKHLDGHTEGLTEALYTRANIGTVLDISYPHGNFVLADDMSPAIFIAQGIGIAPVVSMLESIASQTPLRHAHVIYVTRDGKHFPLRDEIKGLVDMLMTGGLGVFYTHPNEDDVIGRDYDALGMPSVTQLRSVCTNPKAHFYLAGTRDFCSRIGEELRALTVRDERIKALAFDA